MNTLNLSITLPTRKLNILDSLSKHTGYSVNELVNDLISGEITWDEVENLNKIRQEMNDPNIRKYTMEEVEESLITGIIPE